MPLCQKAKQYPKHEETETLFFKSAHELCITYGFQLEAYGHLPYPYNVLLTHRDLTNQLNRLPYDTELMITKEKDKIYLLVKQVFEVGTTLYYIPVIPLFKILRCKATKGCADLLLAVMSYLYREANIPYYRDEDSYMCYQYDLIKEFFLESMAENPDEYEEDIKDILKSEICGDIMQRKIFNSYHLCHLVNTIEKFKPKNILDEECLLVAKDCLQLYWDFPNCNVWQNIDPDENNDEEVASPMTYISFIGDGKGWVYESLERYVNEELGNYSEMAIPSVLQVFDGEGNTPKNLEFEYRLFELITDLCNILFELS